MIRGLVLNKPLKKKEEEELEEKSEKDQKKKFVDTQCTVLKKSKAKNLNIWNLSKTLVRKEESESRAWLLKKRPA